MNKDLLILYLTQNEADLETTLNHETEVKDEISYYGQ